MVQLLKTSQFKLRAFLFMPQGVVSSFQVALVQASLDRARNTFFEHANADITTFGGEFVLAYFPELMKLDLLSTARDVIKLNWY